MQMKLPTGKFGNKNKICSKFRRTDSAMLFVPAFQNPLPSESTKQRMEKLTEAKLKMMYRENVFKISLYFNKNNINS
jgi:hypothetical protein